MNSRQQTVAAFKKKKRHKLLFAAIFIAGIFITAHYVLALLLLVLAYVAHEMFASDHIFYAPQSDYSFTFGNPVIIPARLHAGRIELSEMLAGNIDTLVLPIHIQASWPGYFFDPVIEFKQEKITCRQTMERGTAGLRYLNLSSFCESLRQSRQLEFVAHHCTLKQGGIELLGFCNADYRLHRMLAIAPHADDAELAAFGLYQKNPNTFIATISAGELEATQYVKVAGSLEKAAHLKGRLRAFDSVSVPQWADIPASQCVQLGYFCMTLKDMFENQDAAIPSRVLKKQNLHDFRKFNLLTLPNDSDGNNNWHCLVSDLEQLLKTWQPEVIVTPHPLLDPHPDHYYSTRAVVEACSQLGASPQFLLYANHYALTDEYPFGCEHEGVPLPPHFDSKLVAKTLVSVPLDERVQQDKIIALSLMHDLNRKFPFKRRVRRALQTLLGRSDAPYGDDDYFRKTIRQHELLWAADRALLEAMFESHS